MCRCISLNNCARPIDPEKNLDPQTIKRIHLNDRISQVTWVVFASLFLAGFVVMGIGAKTPKLGIMGASFVVGSMTALPFLLFLIHKCLPIPGDVRQSE